MNDLLTQLSAALEGSPGLSIGAAALLGAVSVVVSPCHLAGVPLIFGVVQARRPSDGRLSAVPLQFGLGVLVSFVVVGGATVAVGRIAGDLGALGNLLGAALFIAFGLQLLEVVELPWLGSLTARGGAAATRPLVLGFLFGASLGPCTFAFMAPALGVALSISAERPFQASGLLLAFALAHTAVLVAAGVFGGATEGFLRSRGATRAVAMFRRLTGVVLILGGLYFLYTMR